MPQLEVYKSRLLLLPSELDQCRVNQVGHEADYRRKSAKCNALKASVEIEVAKDSSLKSEFHRRAAVNEMLLRSREYQAAKKALEAQWEDLEYSKAEYQSAMAEFKTLTLIIEASIDRTLSVNV